MKDEASPAESDPADPPHRFLLALLRPIDGAIGLLQRAIGALQGARNRIEAPASEEGSSRNGRSKLRDEPAPAEPVAETKPGRWRNFLLVTAAMIFIGIAGAMFSYRLLSKSITNSAALVASLRDEVVLLEKESARILNDKARYQKQVNEHDKAMRACQREGEDYKTEAEELRTRLTAMKNAQNARNGTLGQDGRNSFAARNEPRMPPKTGTCTTGAVNAAANLANCVAEFNRR